MNKFYLILESGAMFEGHSPQKKILESAGEVVFNTSHSGYEEIATDPSYMNQIVVLTASMQGNYGVSKTFWESNRIWIEGFICTEVQNSQRESSWLDLLSEHRVPLLSGVDTRQLVMHLRSHGSTWGAIVNSEPSGSTLEMKAKAKQMIQAKKDQPGDWVFAASRKEVQTLSGEVPFGPKIGIIDFGAKENIIREIRQRSSQCILFPARTSAPTILNSDLHGLVLSNGPGDPALVEVAPQTIREIAGKLPMFGICMGHQVLCLALGAKTYKLKFGHRGANHPIDDRILNKIYVSSQNHGYAVDPKTLPGDLKVTQTNLNDQTVAGVFSEKLNILGIQYHPESCPGPHDAKGLFDYFINKMVMEKTNVSTI
jgi:carbamoyl-phosphate synthase small subunit